MHVVIFEGVQWVDFLPFALTRPVFSLRSGTSTLLEKQIRATRPSRLSLWVRPEMVPFVRRYVLPTLNVPTTINEPLDDEPALIFSARTLHLSRLERPDGPCVVLEEDRLVRLAYASVPGLSHDDVQHRTEKFLSLRELPQTMPQARFPRHWADLISWNEESLLSDSLDWTQPAPQRPGVHVMVPEDVHVDPTASIGPNVVLDASKGPILIDAEAAIGANSVLEGPCYVGTRARVSPLSLVRMGTSIGPACRVGGEVGNCIFHAYSNKSHDGFVGDSYIGEWVNLGAGTTTSNLKSTYGLIKLQLGEKEIQSDRVLLGAAIGDHAKTATHTQIPAGAYIGAGSLVALGPRLPRLVPSFSYWTDDCRDRMDAAKLADVAGRMMSRRARTVCEDDLAILRYAHEAAQQLKA